MLFSQICTIGKLITCRVGEEVRLPFTLCYVTVNCLLEASGCWLCSAALSSAESHSNYLPG
eukprot:16314920-Heterocapsa_arctica.AAC.1